MAKWVRKKDRQTDGQNTVDFDIDFNTKITVKYM